MHKTMIIILLVAPPKSLSKQFTGTKNIRTQIMIAKIDYRLSQKKKKIPLTSPCILSMVPPTRGILENFIFVRIAGKIKRVCLSWRGLQVWRKTETGRKVKNLTCSLPPSPPPPPHVFRSFPRRRFDGRWRLVVGFGRNREGEGDRSSTTIY